MRNRQLTLKAKLLVSFTGMVILFFGVALYNLLQVESMKSKVDVQNGKTALEHQALELKVVVQDLKDMSSGLMISRNLDYVKKYNEQRKLFSEMIKNVGDTASTPEQAQWRSQLIMASTDFLNIFDRAVSIIQDKSLKEEDIRINTSILYDQAQEQRDVIFGLVDKFDRDYSKAAADAVSSTYRTMDRTVIVMMALGLFVLVASAVIATLLLRAFLKPVRRLQNAVSVLSSGDLRHLIGTDSEDELGSLSRDFDRMTESVRTMIGSSQRIAAELAGQAEAFRQFSGKTAEANAQIVKAIEDISSGANMQASYAERSASVLGEMRDEMSGIARFTADVETHSLQTKAVTETGMRSVQSLHAVASSSNERIEEVGLAMGQLLDSSKQIGKIVTDMTEIASQTNVLALNASIEAARAGEHGRGFSVVAEQIRLLSAESGAASKNIAQMVTTLQLLISGLDDRLAKARARLTEQNTKVGETMSAFAGIRDSMEEMNDLIETVGTRIGGIHEKNGSLMESVTHVAAIAQESAAAVEEVGAGSLEQDSSIQEIAERAERMHRMSQELFEHVSRFLIEPIS